MSFTLPTTYPTQKAVQALRQTMSGFYVQGTTLVNQAELSRIETGKLATVLASLKELASERQSLPGLDSAEPVFLPDLVDCPVEVCQPLRRTIQHA